MHAAAADGFRKLSQRSDSLRVCVANTWRGCTLEMAHMGHSSVYAFLVRSVRTLGLTHMRHHYRRLLHPGRISSRVVRSQVTAQEHLQLAVDLTYSGMSYRSSKAVYTGKCLGFCAAWTNCHFAKNPTCMHRVYLMGDWLGLPCPRVQLWARIKQIVHAEPNQLRLMGSWLGWPCLSILLQTQTKQIVHAKPNQLTCETLLELNSGRWHTRHNDGDHA